MTALTVALSTAPTFAAPPASPALLPNAVAPLPPAPSTPRAALPIYRLDFELVTAEPGKPAATTTFSLNVVETMHGEAEIVDNVPVSTGSTVSRQDVGMRVKAELESHGADILLDVDTELSALGAGGANHRIVTRDFALASPGKKTMVATIAHDRTTTTLSVVPTRL